MNNFIFENATKVYFGKGCVKEYLACLSSHYGQTVMVCFGGSSIKKNGVYDEVMESLNKAGLNVIEFSGIMANPTYAKVLEGARLARKNKGGYAPRRRRRQRDGLLQGHFHGGGLQRETFGRTSGRVLVSLILNLYRWV